MKFNYNNQKYLQMLDQLNISFYKKYIRDISKYLKENDSFLDIGCGNGNVLIELRRLGKKNISGCDISETFLNKCKEKKLNIKLYKGQKLPYKDESFDVVGSFTVFEHTENPELFLDEKIRILKPEGYLIMGCPNFTTVLYNNPHSKTKGIFNKIRNLFFIVKLLFVYQEKFVKITPINRENFQPDDDARIVTNLVQLEKFFKKKKMKIIVKNGFMTSTNCLLNLIGSLPFLRYLLPSCYLVVQKK